MDARKVTILFLGTFSCLLLVAAPVANATDVDGADDCQLDTRDFGDAPEGIPAYPGPVIGHFPTCLTPTAAGTQELACPAASPPPGPTGFIRHVQFSSDPFGKFWLGCYTDPLGVLGVDSEFDGKTGTPASGTSVCSGILTDCVEAAYGMTFDQDECYLDGSDAGIKSPLTFGTCVTSSFAYEAYACQSQQAVLNVLIDWNHDGDWNDTVECPDPLTGATICVPEWAVLNAPVFLATGCNLLITPPFTTGPTPGPSWLRISLTVDPVPPDYPWNGSAGTPTEEFFGGETEDYPAQVDQPTPAQPQSWGRIKTLYR